MNKKRVEMINNINTMYRYFLTDNTNNNNDELFQLIKNRIYKVDIDKITNILDNINDMIKFISENLNDKWTFERLDNLEKAILIIGVFDIKYEKIQKKIIINECVIIAKMLLTNDNYKYINAILDKI